MPFAILLPVFGIPILFHRHTFYEDIVFKHLPESELSNPEIEFVLYFLQSICVCKPGYTGSGSTCSEVNPCLVNNGGCSLDVRSFNQ